MSAYGNPANDKCGWCGDYRHDSEHCPGDKKKLFDSKVAREATDPELVKDIYSEGLETMKRLLQPHIEKLVAATFFLANTPDLKFIKPTEMRPTWRLIQTEGDAARTLGEAATPHECVLQAMEKMKP